MTPTSITVSIPHGVVFIYDPTMIIEVPSDTGAAPVLATPTCVSIWTRHDIDGPTTLVLADRYEGTDCNLVFQGSLTAQGRKIAFNSSSCDLLIEMGLSTPRAEIAIYANDGTSPTKLVCTVQ